jgi:5-methylcytosine-specific restriction endonuclease McrA
MGNAIYRIGICVESGCDGRFIVAGTRTRCDLHFKGRGFKPPKKAREIVACKWCLQPFERIAGHESRICCNGHCLDALKRQLRKYGTADRSLLPLCVVCYEPTLRDPRGTYCEYHSRRAGDQAKVADGRNNLKNAKRRSAAHDGDAGITVAKLRARDGDFCRACGFKIDFDAAQYDDLAPEIDHIVPLAREGTHTWGNVQLLHGHCNRKKGARLIPDRPTLFDEEIA